MKNHCFEDEETVSRAPAGQPDDPFRCRLLAAYAGGTTKMDRPEWIAVHPANGDVSASTLNKGEYATMGNNQMLVADPGNGETRRFLTGPVNRPASAPNPANQRSTRPGRPISLPKPLAVGRARPPLPSPTAITGQLPAEPGESHA